MSENCLFSIVERVVTNIYMDYKSIFLLVNIWNPLTFPFLSFHASALLFVLKKSLSLSLYELLFPFTALAQKTQEEIMETVLDPLSLGIYLFLLLKLKKKIVFFFKQQRKKKYETVPRISAVRTINIEHSGICGKGGEGRKGHWGRIIPFCSLFFFTFLPRHLFKKKENLS